MGSCPCDVFKTLKLLKTATRFHFTGDFESPKRLKNAVCLSPIAIEARDVETKKDAKLSGQIFQKFDKKDGLICKNHDQV